MPETPFGLNLSKPALRQARGERITTIVFAALLLAACAEAPSAAPAAEEEGAVCSVPADLRAPAAEPIRADEQNAEAETASYLLMLSWSPEFCRTRDGEPWHRHQCDAEPDFGFIVHGLWPQAADADEVADHPRYCATANALPLKLVQQHFCMMPSADLMQHEWASHGTCAFETADAYFAATERLWSSLELPDVSTLAFQEEATAGDVRQAVIAANPELSRDSIYVKVNSGRWFAEIGICYGLDYQPAPCGRTGTPDWVALRIAPRR